jgi:UDP-N-acetylmuramate--alanine ligase
VTGDLVVRAVRAAHPDLDVHSVSHRSDLAAAVDRLLRPGDLCLSMGCGDVESLPDEILERRR